MKKIGILTYHANVNYGATLQAYALYQLLKNWGHYVEFIDYRPRKAEWEDLKYLYFRRSRFLDPFLVPSGIRKFKQMRSFLLSQASLSPQKHHTRNQLSKFVHQYDVVICGSDEIWNVHSSITGFDSSYFLDFLDSKRIPKVSYAPSFGSITDLGKYQELVGKLLEDFQAISVRDNNSLKLVNNFGLEATKVLDPTFLIDYSEIVQAPQINNDYILVYGTLSKKEGNYIEKVAAAKGLDIIAVGGQPGKWKPPINLIGVSPQEWLGYFQKASYVFTSFFHGAVFSLIFNKPFTSFYRAGKAVKVKDLLTDLDAKNRLLDLNSISTETKPKLNFTIDWDSNKLNQAINDSQEFLKNSLKISN